MSAERQVRARPFPLHAVVVPALPALILWSANADELRTTYPSRIMAWSAAFGLLGWAIVSIVQRDLRRSALVAVAATAGATSVGWALSDASRPWANLGVLALLIAVSVVVSVRISDDGIHVVTLMLNAVAVALLVANAALVLVSTPSTPDAQIVQAGPGDAGVERRSVWYLVPDRYPSATTLSDVGVDDGGMTARLEERGFEVYDEARANYPNTRLSLASAWGLDYLDSHADPRGSADVGGLADPQIGREFAAAGYEYTHLGSWPEFTATSASADRVLTLQGANEFWVAWEQRTILPSLRYLLDIGTPDAIRNRRQVEHARHQFEVLHELARQEPSRPEFVLAHLLVPHAPYVFAEDGSRLPDHLVTSVGARQGYERQLTHVNNQLLTLFDELADRDDPPLVVLLSDEGLYPDSLVSQGNESSLPLSEYSSDDFRVKNSVIAAVRDPSGQLRGLPENTSAVNVVRAAVDAALGTVDHPPLADASFRWAGEARRRLMPVGTGS